MTDNVSSVSTGPFETKRYRGRPKVAEVITNELRADIASGRLPLGSRLPNERDLAAHFGVSQPTIREAIRALDSIGLIEVRHGSGAFVTHDVHDFFTTTLQTFLQIERVGVFRPIARSVVESDYVLEMLLELNRQEGATLVTGALRMRPE